MQGLNSADGGKDGGGGDDDDEASSRNKARVGYKNRSGNTDSRGNWDSLKMIQKIRAPHTGKAQGQGTANNSHIGHCAYILFSSY